ncbi:RNA-directed DNA polymerase, eukaryota, reverse transcriptase zinc-binding domain protein, partial [Tanacetum coccineum]
MSLDCRVCDIVERGEWMWPEMWRSKFPVLFLLPPSIIFWGRNDKVLWKTNEGKVVNFSVSTAWADLSIVKPVVPWRKLGWFSQNVPRHAFMLWLAISQKLKTQDIMEKWLVWNHFKELVKWNFAPIALPDIVHYAVGKPINRSKSLFKLWRLLGGVNECNDGRRYSVNRNGACWADDGSWMAWMFWASFLCWACSRVEDFEVLDLDITSVEFINFFDIVLVSRIVISLVCSKVYLAISLLSMFPKHVLGMSFGLTYMGLSI